MRCTDAEATDEAKMSEVVRLSRWVGIQAVGYLLHEGRALMDSK